MRAELLLLVVVCAAGLAVGCAARDGGSSATEPTDATDALPETTGVGEPDNLSVEQLTQRPFSDAPGRPEQPMVVLAPSAAALSGELGQDVPDSGEGTYLAALWGEKATGGYTIAVEGARIEEESVVVRLALEEPPPDAMVTQAFTYPYTVAVIQGLDPAGKRFSFVDEDGQELDWPVRSVGG